MEASVEDLIEYYTKRHVGDCELTCVHDTDTVEALTELRKLREEKSRLVGDGLRTLLELEKLKKEHEWIPVTERLPEEMAGVILAFVYQGSKNVTGDAYMNHGSWWSFGIEITDPIAWRPLPKPPEVGS